MNSSDEEFETDNESIFSDNDVDFDETILNYETIENSNSDKNISKYNELKDQNSPNEKSNEDYLHTNYNPIDINHNPLILNPNEVTKWVTLWVYLFQDTFILSHVANATLLDFLKELLRSFNDVTFADFPSTLYRSDRLIRIENVYINYIICSHCHRLYLSDILDDKTEHIQCECNELITKMVRTSKGKYLVKSIKVYPYHLIIRQLGVFLSKPGIEDLIESCFDRDVEDDIFADIYERRV